MYLTDLPLGWRLFVAFLSGSSIWLGMSFPSLNPGVYWGVDFFHALTGFFLGALVLVPFFSRHAFRIIRAVALIVAVVIIQALVVEMTVYYYGYLDVLGLPEEFEVILNVMFGTVLICAVTGLIAPIKMTRGYIGYAAGAGLISGLSFMILLPFWLFFCFDPCPWWNDLAFVGGWIIWHMAICAAIYFGRPQESSI